MSSDSTHVSARRARADLRHSSCSHGDNFTKPEAVRNTNATVAGGLSHFHATHKLFKRSAYKIGVSMRLFKLQVLSLFKLPFSISGENRSLNEHLGA